MDTLLYYGINKKIKLVFYGDELNKRHDFIVSSKYLGKKIDLLLFFDSRGVSKQYDNSLIHRIISHLPQKMSFLLISRPLEITTWMTLYNFIFLNGIVPKKIITNMGFVDFTPKKKETIEKSILQYNLFFPKIEAKIDFLEKYTDENNIHLDLYQQTYPKKFIDSLEKLLKNTNTIIVNTPLLKEGFFFSRKRPKSFLHSIKIGNNFNHTLKIKKTIIDFEEFDNKLTYDGVHYTNQGNEKLYTSIKNHL